MRMRRSGAGVRQDPGAPLPLLSLPPSLGLTRDACKGSTAWRTCARCWAYGRTESRTRYSRTKQDEAGPEVGHGAGKDAGEGNLEGTYDPRVAHRRL